MKAKYRKCESTDATYNVYNRIAGTEFAKETGRKGSGDGVWRLADSARPPLARPLDPVRRPTANMPPHFSPGKEKGGTEGGGGREGATLITG